MELTFLLEKVHKEKAREGAKVYLERFDTDKAVTVNEAAAMVGIPGIELHLYLAHTDGLGMPETREDALTYLRNITESYGDPTD